MTDPNTPWWLDALAAEENGWSLGTFGAIAEFVRDPGEPAEVTRSATEVSVATGRGAMRLAASPAIVPLAYETPNRDGETWSHAVALCLPKDAAAMNRRTVLTEIGPDDGAVRAQDRDGVLFDMGLGVLQADICIRTRDAGLIDILRASAGSSLFTPGNPAMPAIVRTGPHRVFLCRFGRAEVFQPIPPPDGTSPEGPHTHVLPKLLRTGRTHAATTPIPDEFVPCAHLFPPNPMKDQFGRRRAFDRAAHVAFQDVLDRHGERQTLALKRAVVAGLATGADPESFLLPEWRHARPAVRVALRQALQTDPTSAAAERWSLVFERGSQAEPDDDEQPPH